MTLRIKTPVGLSLIVAAFALLGGNAAQAQTFSEDFTGGGNNNQWYFYNGACLTAGSSASTTQPGQIPGCVSISTTYYGPTIPALGKSSTDKYLEGGSAGYLGGSSAPASIGLTTPDAAGSGALRFTNGNPYGFHENGAIVSGTAFPSNQGLEITFKSVTYLGNSGGSGGDGADGLSFYLMDASKAFAAYTTGAYAPGVTTNASGIGAWGGSLAYTCSNSNPPYDGLYGGYLGLGIDEYGNFLNGTTNTLGETGTTASGDNTASGGGYMWNRIGLRGAGSVTWGALTSAYGSNPSNSARPYYPSTLAQSCTVAGAGYQWNALNNLCNSCSSGNYDQYTNTCDTCNVGTFGANSSDPGSCNTCPQGSYSTGSQLCINICAGGATYNSGTGMCNSCPASGSYSSGTLSSGQCLNSCPTGTQLIGTSCVPSSPSLLSNAGSGNAVYYCPSGNTISGGSSPYYCYPSTAGGYAGGMYCPSGYTISSSGPPYNCYPNSAGQGSGAYYCPAGDNISGQYCYPNTTASVGYSSGFYCPAGDTISGTTFCYPTGDSYSAGTYCASGFTDTSGYCFPATATAESPPHYCTGAGSTISGAFCCPSADPTYSAPICCPSGYVFSSGTTCKSGVKTKAGVTPTGASTAATASAATVPSAATAALSAPGANTASAATQAAVSTTVAAATATPTTATPAEGTPSTVATSTAYPDSVYSVQNTCKTGNLWNYSTVSSPTNAGAAALSSVNPGNTANILDYPAIPGAYSVVSGVKIANESAQSRTQASPIYYDLKLTQDGLLTLSYSLSGAAYQTVIKNSPITASNGPLPLSFLFGFAGSTGGANNVHEIMCFKAVPSSESGGSTAVNQKQSSKFEGTAQAYFGYYDPTPTVWTGDLTANTLTDNNGVVSINTTANWSATCNLTGVNSGFGTLTSCFRTGGTTTAQTALAPSSRVILSWSGSAGIPFEWANLSSTQQGILDFGDTTQTVNRLNFLRGDRTNEFGNAAGSGLFRRRDAVLADIIDSSPTWVGPPSSPYTSNFVDRLYPAAVNPENAVANSYVSFANSMSGRLNVVYVGANDGLLHGFRSGSFAGGTTFVNNASTPNDGQEVLAYMPGSMLSSQASFISAVNPTQSVVQNIHGYTPGNASAVPATVNAITAGDDYTGTQYGHNFFVDAQPGTGDLYYSNAWHTWLVGGLGVGGAAIYALDVTNPSNFSEGNAATTVIGEWNTGMSCVGNTTCGNSLGNTFGQPVIRRFHNGTWGAVFGNGFGSINGDAGIFVLTVNPTSAAINIYYISAGAAGNNGIAYVAPADLDGDHITDYVYAGDLKGNVWRFDLTSSMPSNWAAGSEPLFTTPSGQPITSVPIIGVIPAPNGGNQIIVAFGTGQRTQLTNVAATSYASGQQAIYGVWDWNMSAWNAISSTPYAALQVPTGASPTNTTGLAAPYVPGVSNLTAQSLTYVAATNSYDGSNNAICWQGMSACSANNNSFGWYINLPGTQEQIIYGPTFARGAFSVNSVVPANNVPTSCAVALDTGWTYLISLANGGVLPSTSGNPPFPGYPDTNTVAIQTNATGTSYVVQTVEGTSALVYQTIPGVPNTTQVNLPANVKASRLTWIELR